jgi:epoxyqueuosine reductase
MAQDDPDQYLVLTKSERRRRERLKALPTWGETPEQTRARRTRLVKELALQAGFSAVGIARAELLTSDLEHLQTWLATGKHATMAWLAEDPARRCDPGLVVPGARAVIALTLNYQTNHPYSHEVALQPDRAWVSRYAWGDDYHDLIEKRLKIYEDSVVQALLPELDEGFRGPGTEPGHFKGFRDFRRYVDHGPLLERAWAERAGLGWRGKHSLLVQPRGGSFVFLAGVITTLDLDCDVAEVDHCGNCTACIDACPTAAIVAPRVVDARRCISHASIEIDGQIPSEYRSLLGDHLFGCDRCQEVCPFNRFSTPCGEPAFEPRPGLVAPLLSQIETVCAEPETAALAGSSLRRRGAAGLLDNVAAVREGRPAILHPAPNQPTLAPTLQASPALPNREP